VAQVLLGRLRPRIFLTFWHYKGGRSSAKWTGRLYPKKNPWYSLSEAELTSGHMVLSGEPRKKSPVTPPGINPRTVQLVAQCLNHYATPSPTSLKILTCKCKNRQLTGEGTDKTCQMAQLAASPCWIMNEINTTVVGIHHSNYKQVWAHEHVSNSQICDQEWVHLTKEEMSVVFIQQTKTNSLNVTQHFSYPHWIPIFTGLQITYKTAGTSSSGNEFSGL